MTNSPVPRSSNAVRMDFNRICDLVGLAKGGDAVALDVLLAYYAGELRSAVRRRLGNEVRHGAVVDSLDLVQDTLMTAVDKLKDIEVTDERSVINWLATIANHRIGDYAKYAKADKRDTRRTVPLAAGSSGTFTEPETRHAGPLSELEQREGYERIEQAIDDLSPKQRLVTRERLEGKSWDDVAKDNGLPSDGAAQAHGSRARVALRAKLMPKAS